MQAAESRGQRRRVRRARPSTYLYFGLLFAAIVFLSHATLITMPYFWDECGYFIPATLDLFQRGAVVPQSVQPAVHPPLVMSWVAGWWSVAGAHEAVTRAAMLLLASFTLLAVFVLAIELCGSLPGVPALITAGLLAISPLFYTQALLAQLDLPATLFTALSLWLFLRERHAWACLTCTLLVLTKETGAVLPVVLLVYLLVEKRFRLAAWYAVPLLALGGWLLMLKGASGYWLGSASFGKAYLGTLRHPVPLALALVRRLYFVFGSNLHFLGLAGIVLAWRAGLLNRRRWKVVAAFGMLHLVAITVLGGAVLEREALPVLPLFYTAAVVGFHTLRQRNTALLTAGLATGLLAGLAINPPLWPFPYENNLSMTAFTEVHQMAATYLEQKASRKAIATAWPLSAELTRPGLGYVSHRLLVFGLRDFSEEELARASEVPIDVFVRFSQDWDPPRNLLGYRAARYLARVYLKYQLPVSPDEIEKKLKLKLVASWSRRGQWVEIYTR